MKRFVLMLFAGAFSLCLSAAPVRAGEVDVLINKLVEKGVLSRPEATELLKEMQREGMKQEQEIRQVAKEAAKEEAKAGGGKLPGWVEKMNLKGDLRLRYQGEQRENTDGSDGVHRDRGRIRYRLGIDTEVNDQWKAGFGIASGSDDPRSTNQTLTDVFSSKPLQIDYAYAQYKPFKWLEAVGGKFKDPLYETKDLLWDGDIRPEGVAAKVHHKVRDDIELFFTPTFYLVNEVDTSTSDPVMWAFQAGVNWKFAKDMYVKFAPTYYVTDHFKGSSFGHRGRTTNNVGNTTDASGNYVFDYNALGGDAEVGFELPGPVPFIAIFGEYVQSDADDSSRPAASRQGGDENQGWLAGLKFGHKSVKDLWQWKVTYNYRSLEKDAWPDFLPDSDFYGGSTNAEGHEVEFELGIHKHVTIGADYYHSKIKKPSAGNGDQPEDLLQVDLVLSF